MSANRSDFDNALKQIFLEAEAKGVDSIDVTSKTLHERVGGYPGKTHRMPTCCDAMRAAMGPKDLILNEPQQAFGAFLKILYVIPRPNSDREIPISTPKLNTLAVDSNFQRIGAVSNSHVGTTFEAVAKTALSRMRINVESNFAVPLGISTRKRKHRFDLGCATPPRIVECKCHRWTLSGNTPSAKLTVWNEAMYYFSMSPKEFRKIFFVLRDYSETRNCTLAEHYLSRCSHLVPDDVEFWEYNEETCTVRVLPMKR